ncbi:MAG: PAS domain S-box protein [Actinobacteria bacterium]|nr:PAS domain S-box protein [Actinomycetota bacterium]
MARRVTGSISTDVKGDGTVPERASEIDRASDGPDPVALAFSSFHTHFREPRFWAVQGLIILVTLLHVAIEATEQVTRHDLGAAYFVPASLYFIPVLYASLNFGREGAIPTAVWSGILALPNILIWHSGLERAGESLQMTLMVGLAVVVAGRVDREIVARRRAEAEGFARRASERRYRALFQSAGEAIILLGPTERIEEANAEAGNLVGRPASRLRGSRLTDVMDADSVERLLRVIENEDRAGTEILVRSPHGPDHWIEPVSNRFDDPRGGAVTQVILRDVTEQRARRRGLETYAQQMLRAQEEERIRVAREVHDGALQSLFLVCRQLDGIEVAVTSESSAVLSERIGRARDLTESTVDELRRLSRALRPSVLDDLGLVPAVRHLVKDLDSRSGMRARFEMHGQLHRLHPDVELCLFRIVQEALRNVEQHAEASNVVAHLGFEVERVRSVVVDDGRGFEGISADAFPVLDGRFGLMGMKERALLLGGTFDLSSEPGRGVRVEACIPAGRWSETEANPTP